MSTAPVAEALARSADPMLPAAAKVVARWPETADVATLQIAAPGWTGCDPGQFTMLGLPGVGEIPVSVSGGCAPGTPLRQTIRAVGPVSRALAALGPGDWLTVRGPYGRGWPVQAAAGRTVLVVAGGLGLAPLRPVVDAVARDRSRFGAARLIVGARGPGDLMFPKDHALWEEAGIAVTRTVDHAPPGWPGKVGVVTTQIAPPDGPATAFLCGPEIMMRLAAQRLMACGLAADDIFVSLERNMQCGVGLCGHCQVGAVLLCRDGPVLDWAQALPLLQTREL